MIPKSMTKNFRVYATCDHILGAFRAGRPADVSAEDNLKTFAVCEAAYESAETGKAVKPSYSF